MILSPVLFTIQLNDIKLLNSKSHITKEDFYIIIFIDFMLLNEDEKCGTIYL